MLPFLHQPFQTKNNNATGPSSTVSYTQQCRSWPHSLLSFIRKSFKNDLHTATEQRMKIQQNNMSLPLRATVPRAQILRSTTAKAHARSTALRPTCLPSHRPPPVGAPGPAGVVRPLPAGPGIGPTRRRRSLAATSHKGCVPPSPRALRLGPQHAATPTTRSVVLRLSPAMGSGRAAAAENGGRRCAPARPCRPTRCDQRREPFPGLGSGPPA